MRVGGRIKFTLRYLQYVDNDIRNYLGCNFRFYNQISTAAKLRKYYVIMFEEERK